MSHPSIEQARSLFGDRLIAPRDVAAAFGDDLSTEASIPFRQDELAAAAKAGEVLIYRPAAAAGAPLTILALIQRFPQTFDPKLLQASGYQLKNEWGIELEPLAANDTCSEGWALFQPRVLAASCNRSYYEQDETLRAYEVDRSLRAGAVRRRTAVEAVFDTVMCYVIRNQRLLEKTWDWTSTMTVDRGLLHVGGFGSSGMQVLGFSPGIRHGGLGVCPTYQAQ